MRVLITGASGMLGGPLVTAFHSAHTVVPLSMHRPADTTGEWLSIDISVPGQLKEAVQRVRPDAIVHAAAITNVDECELQPERAMRVNRDSVGELAEYCDRTGARLIFISTDAVFDGQKPGSYSETDVPQPINVYGRAKLAGERLALDIRGALVLRTNIFGWRGSHPPSLAEWILSGLRTGTPLTMFTDITFSPISASLLAPIVRQCTEVGASGLYHAGGSETISKYDFCLRLARACGLRTDNVRPISVEEKGLAARRPKNIAMDCSKLEGLLGYPLPGVDESIAAWQADEPVRRR